MKLNNHILIFSPGFPSNEDDGSCLPALQNYVLQLSRTPGVKVSVLSLHYPFSVTTYKWNNVQVYALGGANRSYPSRLMVWMKAYNALRELHSKQAIDVIHSFWMHECGMIGNYFAKRFRIPHIITLMGQDMKPPNYFSRMVDQSYPTLVSLSAFNPSITQAGIRKPDAVIPFGIIKENSDWAEVADKTIDVLGVGSLIPLKNYSQFLRVIAILKNFRPMIRAEIIGEGWEIDHLRLQIKRLQLESNVVMVGPLSREEIFARMSRSRVFLHTSDYESQGYVFNEALACGVPIVSKKVGIAEERLYWKVEETDEMLAFAVKHFLDSDIQVDSYASTHMEDTVKGYLHLYGKLNGSGAKS